MSGSKYRCLFMRLLAIIAVFQLSAVYTYAADIFSLSPEEYLAQMDSIEVSYEDVRLSGPTDNIDLSLIDVMTEPEFSAPDFTLTIDHFKGYGVKEIKASRTFFGIDKKYTTVYSLCIDSSTKEESIAIAEAILARRDVFYVGFTESYVAPGYDRHISGDVNCDNYVTAEDAALLMQKVLRSEFVLSIEEKYPAVFRLFTDVDGDGIFTSSDVAHILQKSLDSGYKMPVDLDVM